MGTTGHPAGGWTLVTAVVRAWHVLREEGIRALWFRLLSVTCYRRLLLMERRLDTPIAPVVADRSYEIRIDRIPRDRNSDSGHEALRFTALVDGIAVGSIVGRRNGGFIPYLGIEFPVTPNNAFLSDAMVHPDFRRRGTATLLTLTVLHHYRALGYARVTALVLPENAAAVRLWTLLGCRSTGLIGTVGIGARRWVVRRKFSADPDELSG